MYFLQEATPAFLERKHQDVSRQIPKLSNRYRYGLLYIPVTQGMIFLEASIKSIYDAAMQSNGQTSTNSANPRMVSAEVKRVKAVRDIRRDGDGCQEAMTMPMYAMRIAMAILMPRHPEKLETMKPKGRLVGAGMRIGSTSPGSVKVGILVIATLASRVVVDVMSSAVVMLR
ncbi:hypothetical protein CC78DRAFT_540467 [Lojkania enalia]|uniref:Uncharacterized protein n=1 Tax=Lojkania enalia TaxID=147567 RepID=A0A9P4TNE6_9PLEO|nr:hypothetical protein CC78DRAFT_540467 [Didymosphaeria enalia]